jgi:hypothetical protein
MARKTILGDLILVHWHAEEAEEFAAALREAGWKIQVGMGELREVKTNPPTAVVISLRRLPSHGRVVADALWYTKWGRAIPIVFFDGEADKVEATRTKFPDARFVSWTKLPTVLKELAAERTSDSSPSAKSSAG